MKFARRLNGVDAGFSGPDPDRFLDVRDENLAVPDPPGLSRAPDRLDGFFNHVVTEDNFDLHFGKEIHDVLGTRIKLGMPFLASKTLGFGDGDALQADLLQRLLPLVELERLDDRLELLHRVFCPPGPRGNAPFTQPRKRLAGSMPRRRNARKPNVLRQFCPLRRRGAEAWF